MNSVNLIGRISSDFELKKTKGDKEYTSFTIAVNAFSKDKKEVDFIRCIAWGQKAINICKYLKKGSKLFVEGTLKVLSTKDEQGNYKTNSFVNVNKTEFLDSQVKTDDRKWQDMDSKKTYQANYQERDFGNDDDSILWDD